MKEARRLVESGSAVRRSERGVNTPALLCPAGGRHDADAAAAVHARGDGPGADGEEPVQGETDGAAGGRPVDRDDQVGAHGSDPRPEHGRFSAAC